MDDQRPRDAIGDAFIGLTGKITERVSVSRRGWLPHQLCKAEMTYETAFDQEVVTVLCAYAHGHGEDGHGPNEHRTTFDLAWTDVSCGSTIRVPTPYADSAHACMLHAGHAEHHRCDGLAWANTDAVCAATYRTKTRIKDFCELPTARTVTQSWWQRVHRRVSQWWQRP